MSLKSKSKSTSSQITPSPQFSVTQHYNSSSHLVSCLELFQTGRIYYKAGSNATLVYTVDNRKLIQDVVLPFWKRYLLPYQLGDECQSFRFANFEQLLKLLEDLSKEGLAYQVLPPWNSLRKQQGHSNERFKDLKKAQDFVLSC